MDDRVASRLFALSTGVFFVGGFTASLLSLLAPRFRMALALDYTSTALIQFASHSSYLLLALPIAAVVAAKGYMRAHAAGLFVMAASLIGVIAGAATASFPLTLAALFGVSAGATFLQIASNTAVTMVGDPARAAMRLNLLQGLNAIGTVLGPLVGSWFILDRSSLDVGASWLAVPFGVAVVILVVFGVFFWRDRDLLRSVRSARSRTTLADWRRALSRRRLRFGAVAIFAYVGAEVTIGALLVDVLTHDPGLGITPVIAGSLVSLYWGGAMIGRFVGAWLLRHVAASRLLFIAGCAAGCLVLLAITGAGAVAAAALLSLGLFNSIMYPTIYVLALPRDPAEATPGATILCMAVVGGAVIPVLTGILADRIGLVPALMLPMLCYAAIAAFAHASRRGDDAVATTR